MRVSDLGISLTISLATRRWILSSCSLSFCEKLHHAVGAYSRIGRIDVVYNNCVDTLEGRFLKRRSSPIFFAALEQPEIT